MKKLFAIFALMFVSLLFLYESLEIKKELNPQPRTTSGGEVYGKSSIAALKLKYYLLDDGLAAYDLAMIFFWDSNHTDFCTWAQNSLKSGFSPEQAERQLFKQSCGI